MCNLSYNLDYGFLIFQGKFIKIACKFEPLPLNKIAIFFIQGFFLG